MNRIITNKYRKNKIDIIKRIIVLFILICVLIFSILSIFNKAEANANKVLKVKTYNVGKGETLWTIANIEKNNNNYYRFMDVQDIVEDIKNINSLNDEMIYINQKLYIVCE